MKLEKVLGHFINSYDSLLSVVTSQKELSPTDQKSVEEKFESCVQKNDEVHAQTVEKTDIGLVNHGLKIDVTTSSPFRRRFNAKRPQRTHSCREPRSGRRNDLSPHLVYDRVSSEQNIVIYLFQCIILS